LSLLNYSNLSRKKTTNRTQRFCTKLTAYENPADTGREHNKKKTKTGEFEMEILIRK